MNSFFWIACGNQSCNLVRILVLFCNNSIFSPERSNFRKFEISRDDIDMLPDDFHSVCIVYDSDRMLYIVPFLVLRPNEPRIYGRTKIDFGTFVFVSMKFEKNTLLILF